MTRRELREAKRAVRRVLEGVAADVAGLPRPAMRELMPALVEAEREVTAALNTWLSTVPDGATRFTAHEYRKVLLGLRTAQYEVGARASRLPRWVFYVRERMLGALWRGSERSGALATAHLTNQVATFSQVFSDSFGGSVDVGSASIMAQGEEMLIPRFTTSANRYTGAVWADMKRQLAIGIARKETVDQLSTRLQGLGGPKAANMGEGLFTRYRHWADRVVRTETINAYNVQQLTALKSLKADNPDMRQRWDASLDSRLCVICSGLHGEVVDIGAEFPGGYSHPPAHPNCRCALIAWSLEWGDDNLPQEKLTPEIHQEAP